MTWIGYAASIAMGVTLGLLGSGGSILTVPILVYLFNLSPLVATGYSLFVVGTTALVGSRGEVDLRAAFTFALPSIIGVNISRGIVIPRIPMVVAQIDSLVLTKQILIMVTFAALMVAASYSMIQMRGGQKKWSTPRPFKNATMALQGLAVGMIAGFVGAGGGFLIIPALVLMIGLKMRIAIGTSLTVITTQSLLGFTGDVLRGLVVDWSLLGGVTSCAILGILVGSAVSVKIQEQRLKTAFGWFVLVVGITVLIDQGFRISSR